MCQITDKQMQDVLDGLTSHDGVSVISLDYQSIMPHVHFLMRCELDA